MAMPVSIQVLIVACSITLLLISALIASIALFLYCLQPRRGERDLNQPPLEDGGSMSQATDPRATDDLQPSSVRAFSLMTLRDCTDGFKETHKIGEKGAFGDVYRVTLEGREVAIKVMKGTLTRPKRKQFVAEVNTLSRVHHCNLIELIGYSNEGTRCTLVYPFYPGGSLYQRLHKGGAAAAIARKGSSSPPPLTLFERASIANQIASAIQYLHHGADPQVIHRDIKSSNVLLSDGVGKKLRAVLADFGLATIVEKLLDTTHQCMLRTSHVAGTDGYIAPEYLVQGLLTAKADVYAFGVLVLELLTARMPLEPALASEGGGFQALPAWVQSFVDCQNVNLLGPIIDQRLRRELSKSPDAEQMALEMLWLALSCVHEDFEQRPDIALVADRLVRIMAAGI